MKYLCRLCWDPVVWNNIHINVSKLVTQKYWQNVEKKVVLWSLSHPCFCIQLMCSHWSKLCVLAWTHVCVCVRVFALSKKKKKNFLPSFALFRTPHPLCSPCCALEGERCMQLHKHSCVCVWEEGNDNAECRVSVTHGFTASFLAQPSARSTLHYK